MNYEASARALTVILGVIALLIVSSLHFTWRAEHSPTLMATITHIDRPIRVAIPDTEDNEWAYCGNATPCTAISTVIDGVDVVVTVTTATELPGY